MAKNTDTHDIRYEWPLMVAALNRRASRKRLRPGELSICTGVDGRYTGGLVKHGGMKHLTTISAGTIVDAQYVSIQKGSTAYLLRGFLVLCNDSGYKLQFHYYDEDPGVAAWASDTLTAGSYTLTANTVFDTSGPAKYCYIAIDGEDPLVYYHDGTNFVEGTMGPGALYDSIGDTGLAAPDYDAGTGEVASGNLSAGTYGIAYRFYNSNRGIYSEMSATLSQTISGDDKKIQITNPYAADPDGPYQLQGYTTLQVFRTLTVEVGGTYYQAGLFYLEIEYALDAGADCWPATVAVGTESDETLLYVEVYDPFRGISGSPPQSGTIQYLEGVNFMGSDSSAGSVVSQLQWSHLHMKNPEIFPVTGHAYVWPSDDGIIQRFVRAGDMLFAFADGAAYRIAKSGSQLTISRMHAGRGLVSRKAAHEMGRDIMAVTDLGVTIFDGVSGAVNTIGSLDRLIYDDWAATLGNVITVADARTGASYILNTDQEEAAIVWHVTGAVSMLDDCAFVTAAQGPHPEDGGQSRAYFLTANGRIVYPDGDATGSGTMMGLPTNVTAVGTATGGSTTTLEMTTAANWSTANLKDSLVYVWDATSGTTADPVAATITSTTADTLTFANIGFTVASGDRFTISPVPFRVRPWQWPAPVGLEEFSRRVVRSVQVNSVSHSGMSSNPNAVWRMGLCRNLEASPGSDLVVVDIDDNISEQYGRVNRDGHVLEPWVEHISAGTGFELLSIGVDGIITVSRRTN